MFQLKISLFSLPLLYLALVFSLLVGSGVKAAIVQPTSATAVFNLNGVTGWIRFFHSEPEPIAGIIVNLQGLAQEADWSIHQLPVDETLSPSDRCTEAYLGGVYNPTNAPVVDNPQCNVNLCPVGDLSGRLRPINSNGVDWFNETTNPTSLQGPQSIVGRSLLLTIGSKRVCSTIRSKRPGDITTLQATFISPVAGTVYFRQSGNEPTIIHGKLFWINEMTTTSVEWSIYDDLLDETYRAGDCGNQSLKFDSGNLTARHGMISISDTPLPYGDTAFLFTDETLKISEGIDGRSLILRQGGSVIACAPIVISESIETFQYPEFDLRISQSSPYENNSLVLSANFKNLNSAYTILDAAWMTTGLCPLAAEIYNPLGVVAPGDDVPFRTPDLFEYGNISGKFSSLLGPSQTLGVPELPMYGAFSMLGLTLRAVGKNPANPYRICSALVPLKDENTLLAKATFTEGSVKGAIYFLQRQDPEFSGQPGVTNIIVDVHLNNSAVSKMSGWNIQATPTEGSTCSTSAGSSYNPFSVVRGANYNDECTTNSPLRCENGDLTGKHGELTIGPLGPSRSTFTFIDSNLQLDQRYKIIGQSVGLYSTTGSSLLGCAKIQVVKPSDPQYDVIIAFPEDADFERIAFTKKLVEISSLADKVDPSDLLILHEEVGMITSENQATTCATIQLKLTASSVEEANSYAVALQSSVCNKFANNGCMNQLPDYNRLCIRGGVVTTTVTPNPSDRSTSDAQRSISALQSIILLIATLAMIKLF